jgi:tRNA(adenine34) deaminase
MTDVYFMNIALREAMKAYEEGEVPVGAIVVAGERILARGHNMVEKLKDPTAHAEIIALTSAFNLMGAKYLPDCTLYVTVEPCLMCAGALYWSKIGGVVWGADDEKNGHRRLTQSNWPFHPKTTVRSGVLKEECEDIMKAFFKKKR